MNHILVTYAGRAPGLNFCKSLRKATEKFFIVGIDDNKYSIMWAEADKKILVPSYKSEKYIDLINKICDEYQIDVIYPSKSNGELLLLAANRDKLHARIFLPDEDDVILFEDKWLTYLKIKELNLCRVPQTYLIHNKEELEERMRKLSGDGSCDVWIRRIYGSGGAGSISTKDINLAVAWIDRFHGWGKFTISEKLSEKTMTWSAIWKDGKLITSKIRERLYWEFANRTPSGVTGITGAQRVICDNEIDRISENIIRALSNRPNGTIGIDYTLGYDGKPYLTEIQASRLYTSTLFMASCGLNLPYILYKCAMDEELSPQDVDVEIDSNQVWLKYIENEPFLISMDEIKSKEYEMEQLLNHIADES